MFVSAITVAILSKAIHEPFPSTCAYPIEIVHYNDFEQFIHAKARLYIDCAFEPDPNRIAALQSLLPEPVLINAVDYAAGPNEKGVIRFNGWPGFGYKPVLELAGNGEELPESLLQFAMACGLTCIQVPDKIGLVRPRVVSMIINEAYFTLAEGVSTRHEIDTAMKLGTNYPFGPFEWGEKIGLQRIVRLLVKLAETDSKYQPAPNLLNASQLP
ncbi:3-hydroxyacyl-CoA dehydrogenase family protein [Flavihumibacter profundi]|uniref:3-hydroxyacyl-CoA dehydrogenase family protein n=1 Tax=Flavihumibacter profundi TaxID=2716883 RepID=UPI001CC44C34|nr:3-hydroxyacyl-CoA dehydrogenase family protein [Flavihumibacter profundi]MBZ5857935.1 hypothetical protein [Flavihumibacter profundi]